MSSVKLSEMPIADSIVGDEKVPILQNSENKVALISNILSKINLSNYYTKTEVDTSL
jgi:transcription antitermination factor NusA-like protein